MENELPYQRFRLNGPILYPMRGCNGQLTQSVSSVDNTELDKVSSRDLYVVNTVAEIEGRAMSWRRTVVTLMTMGLNGLNNRP
jgi:hypothetical protein